MSTYSATIAASNDCDPFDGSIFLSLVDTEGNESNEVVLDLSGETVRAGFKKQVDGLELALAGSVASVKIRTEATGSSNR